MTIWHEYNGLDRMFSDASRERTVQNTVYFCRYFWSTAHLFLLLALNTLRSLARVWFHKRNVGALHHSFIEQHVNILTLTSTTYMEVFKNISVLLIQKLNRK